MEKCCEFCGRGIEGYSRSTRKYCDDNCKQLAYYARQGMSWGKTELSGVPVLPFNVKPDFTLNDTQHAYTGEQTEVEQNITIPPLEKQTVSVKHVAESQKNPPPVEQRYCWVNSPLLNAIERNRDRIENMFLLPEHYWTQDAIPVVRWVTIRVRCILENIIRLSNFGRIDIHTIKQLTTALDRLSQSWQFRAMPKNYPFTDVIRSLCKKIQQTALQAGTREVSFRLSMERKAQYLAYKFMIGDFAPRCRFSELDFGEQQELH